MRKRREYRDMVPDYYDLAAAGGEASGSEELGALRQVGGLAGMRWAVGGRQRVLSLRAPPQPLCPCPLGISSLRAGGGGCAAPVPGVAFFHLLPAADTAPPVPPLTLSYTVFEQVAVDVPRTAPGVAFFHQPQIQKSLERILYIWGIR